MKILLRISLLLIPIVFALSSCQKEVSEELDSPGGSNSGGGGGGGGGNNSGNAYNSSCNNVVQKIKRVQATFSANEYTEVLWNADGTVKSIEYRQQLSENTRAEYVYASGKIQEAVLYRIGETDPYDTVVYRYNSDGLVDSMYRKNSTGQALHLKYTNGNLSRVERGDELYYWVVTTDAKGNITKAEEYWRDNGVYNKESTFTYTRDDRKNPFNDLAVYMLYYLDDEYSIFRDWGPNNYIDQRYQDHTSTGIDLSTGCKYKYNSNCYPESYQNTIMGQVLLPDPDFTYSYY